MPPTSPPPADPSRPRPESHASGDEDDVTERRSLLAPDLSEAHGPGAAAAAAAAVGRPGGAALYIEGAGRHQPICGGQCLWVQGGDDACDMAWFSALLVLVPVGVWLYAVSPELWNLGFLGKLLCLLTVAATTADMVFLAAAYLSDPGILPTTLVDDDVVEREDAPRGSGGWHMGMAPPTAKGQHYRIIVRGQRYQLIEFRAKFCRETENCIENFDHYCPWVGNAVGRRNYRYFVFFVAGANLVAACVFGGSTVVVVLVAQANGGGVALAVALAPLPVFLIVYTVIILCTVGGLLGYHIGLVSTNTTTNESIKGVYALGRNNPYNLGAVENWRRFFSSPLDSRPSYVTGRWKAYHNGRPTNTHGEDLQEVDSRLV